MEVEVIGRKPYRETIPAQVLDGKRLEALEGHSVADAMRYFAGIQIKDYGGVGGVKTVDMRSMGTNHMGIFYDGIQLGNAQNGQIDLGKFSLDNIEQISLYNGRRSEILQSAEGFGSAGTVYLESRRPKFPAYRRLAGSLTMRLGSFGVVNPAARLDYKFSDKVSATLSAEYLHATGRYKFRYRRLYEDGEVAWDTTAVRQNGDIRAWRLEGGLYGNLRRGSWQAKAYYYDSERGIPGAIVNNVWKNSQRQWDRNFFLQGRFQKYITPRYALQINAKYARDHMRYLNPDTTLMYIDNTFDQNEIYISAAQRLTLIPGWDAALSVDYQWNQLDADLAMFAHPVRNTVMAALSTAAAFGPVRAQGSLLATFVADRTHTADPAGGPDIKGKKHFRRWTPAIFFSYQPLRDEEFHLRAFFKQTFRMPTFNDLYYTDVGNASLRPERTTQYDAGISYTTDFAGSRFWQQMHLSADGYYNLVNDKIIAVPKGNGQYRWMMMNIGKVHIGGLDLTGNLQVNPIDQLLIGLNLSYTLQYALDYSDPSDNDAYGTYRGQISYIPRHSGSVAGHAQWRGASLDYSFIYVGERYTNSSNIEANRVLPWYTHDLTLSYRLELKKHMALRFTLEINNLFDQQYEVISNYPMPGRNFKGILNFEF